MTRKRAVHHLKRARPAIEALRIAVSAVILLLLIVALAT